MRHPYLLDKLALPLRDMLADWTLGIDRQTLILRHARHGLMAERASEPVRVRVVIEGDPESDLASLTGLDIQINRKSDGFLTALMPLSQLERLCSEATVHRILTPETLVPALDLAVTSVNLPIFQQATHLSGRGVIVGFIDTGFDPGHKALKGRTLCAWDQLAPGGNGVREGQYGVELSGKTIDQLTDELGHGTHVAGIAVGNLPRYQGVAPRADLVLVRSDLTTDRICDGLHYIFRIADELERAAVINLSLSSAPGVYDGTDHLCKTIDDLSGPGKIVCCAAGNYGESRFHARIDLAQDETVAIPFSLSPDLRKVSVQGVYGSKNQVAFAVGDMNNTVSAWIQDHVPAKQGMANGIEIEFSELTLGRPLLKFELGLSEDRIKATKQWRLLLRGDMVVDGCIDLWLRGEPLEKRMIDHDDMRFDAHVDNIMQIGTPGAAAQAITVACYTTRTEWKDRLHNMQPHPKKDVRLHDISPCSSAGPLIDGRQKPDVTAPGAWIISALADNSSVKMALKIDKYYAVRDGTSMAAAFISGAVALLLERNPRLTPEEIKQRLRKASRIPNMPAGTHDPHWGWGLIDMSKLI